MLTTVAEENLAGVRTVKAFAREKHEIEKFLSHNNRYYELNVSQAKVLTKYYPLFLVCGKGASGLFDDPGRYFCHER